MRKMEKVYGLDAENSEGIKLEFLMNPDNSALDSKYSRHLLSSRMDAQRIGTNG
jgi:hypothetical protein